MNPKPLKPKRCKVCPERFTPRNSMQVVCSPKCGLEYAAKQRKKKVEDAAKLERKQDREKKKSLQKLSYFEKKTQDAVNGFVRVRDSRDGCISCDKPANWWGQWHASHYKSVGANSFLRYNLWNIHKSCSQCNRDKSGNLLEYTPRLEKKIGKDRVEWLRNSPRSRVYDREYLERMEKIFLRRTRLYKRLRGIE